MLLCHGAEHHDPRKSMKNSEIASSTYNILCCFLKNIKQTFYLYVNTTFSFPEFSLYFSLFVKNSLPSLKGTCHLEHSRNTHLSFAFQLQRQLQV